MKLHILLSLIAIFGTVLAQQQSTSLSFFAEYEDQQEEDYIELGLTVKVEGSSLVKAIDQASKIAEQIKQIATEFCQAHSKKKTDCKDIVELSGFDINPKYQIVKRQSKFIGFEVQHQVSIKVLDVDHISDLADAILKQQNVKIVSFEWKPLEQVNSEQVAVKQGTQQGSQLCDQLGMDLGSIENIQEVKEQQQQGVSVYKFTINCLPGRKQIKKAKQDQKAEKGQKKANQKADDIKDTKKDKKDDKKQEKKDDKKVKQEKKDDKKAAKSANQL